MIAMNLLKFKNISDDYDLAFQLVSYLFHDKKDKDGIPYINHLVSVSNMLDTRTTKIAGLLHDVLEDIPNFTVNDLKMLGFSDEVVEIVKIVTKDKTNKESYHDWITKIIKTKNIDALKVKYADIKDHLNAKRLSLLNEEKKLYFISKYSEEKSRLEKALISA